RLCSEADTGGGGGGDGGRVGAGVGTVRRKPGNALSINVLSD
ncbi:unnamed protein product, partial [Rotaria magnacalcarata]